MSDAIWAHEHSHGACPTCLREAGEIIHDLRAKLEQAEQDRNELQQIFDQRWRADQRAIEKWREGHPERELVRPDHADLCVWLGERAEHAERERAKLVEVVAGLSEDLRRLHNAVCDLRQDFGTRYPALAEAWGRSGMRLVEAEGLLREVRR